MCGYACQPWLWDDSTSGGCWGVLCTEPEAEGDSGPRTARGGHSRETVPPGKSLTCSRHRKASSQPGGGRAGGKARVGGEGDFGVEKQHHSVLRVLEGQLK